MIHVGFRHGQHQGFTLIEMSMTLVIFSVIALGGFQLLSSGMLAYNDNQGNLQAMSKAAHAASRLGQEVRNSASGGISAVTSNSLQFTKTDGTVVSVALAGSRITLDYDTLAGGPYTLCDEVTAFTLNYYTGDGATATADPALVAYVDIALTVTHDGRSYARQTRVALRN